MNLYESVVEVRDELVSFVQRLPTAITLLKTSIVNIEAYIETVEERLNVLDFQRIKLLETTQINEFGIIWRALTGGGSKNVTLPVSSLQVGDWFKVQRFTGGQTITLYKNGVNATGGIFIVGIGTSSYRWSGTLLTQI